MLLYPSGVLWNRDDYAELMRDSHWCGWLGDCTGGWSTGRMAVVATFRNHQAFWTKREVCQAAVV